MARRARSSNSISVSVLTPTKYSPTAQGPASRDGGNTIEIAVAGAGVRAAARSGRRVADAESSFATFLRKSYM
jgi:hypothetical protein